MWRKISDILPEQGVEVILFNKNWVDEDFNPNGTRVGFLNIELTFTSAMWWGYQDTYMTVSEPDFERNPEVFAEDTIKHVEPTHWHLMPETIGNAELFR